MGHKLIIFLAILLSVYANTKYPDIDNLIEKVKVKRIGLTKQEIKNLKNPFINEKKLIKIIKKTKFEKKTSKKRIFYKLYTIFGSRAKINGHWYTVGSKIGSYRLVSIGTDSVVLKNKVRELRLFLPKHKRQLIKFYNRSK